VLMRAPKGKDALTERLLTEAEVTAMIASEKEQDLRRYAICSGIRFAIPNFKKKQLIEPERVSLRSSRN